MSNTTPWIPALWRAVEIQMTWAAQTHSAAEHCARVAIVRDLLPSPTAQAYIDQLVLPDDAFMTTAKTPV